uniref:Uncharacterized protein n=1 Tax=Siphoviridae sp. ctEEM24 TaxID=2826203 RepID=A0A8S5LZ30_9CAUD|nr:MAG TPA: hypothetical protein [Siphoviridae sp. ctEEM24]DAG72738.1 MAG TPA: hypothetical protein [Caudoviricetes sp.]DAL71525.1 MAG TPA: hypothetical protein [Caudoviricetes sp.]DAL83695.1 MAG TPA: hypothetical protein [Caudoviricetes sp.]DAS20291.1 MAG TPA: hypothetical protein [Caudoviricetes sp.]
MPARHLYINIYPNRAGMCGHAHPKCGAIEYAPTTG